MAESEGCDNHKVREELHKESKPDVSQSDLRLSLSICKILQLGNAEQIGPAQA